MANKRFCSSISLTLDDTTKTCVLVDLGPRATLFLHGTIDSMRAFVADVTAAIDKREAEDAQDQPFSSGAADLDTGDDLRDRGPRMEPEYETDPESGLHW